MIMESPISLRAAAMRIPTVGAAPRSSAPSLPSFEPTDERTVARSYTDFELDEDGATRVGASPVHLMEEEVATRVETSPYHLMQQEDVATRVGTSPLHLLADEADDDDATRVAFVASDGPSSSRGPASVRAAMSSVPAIPPLLPRQPVRPSPQRADGAAVTGSLPSVVLADPIPAFVDEPVVVQHEWWERSQRAAASRSSVSTVAVMVIVAATVFTSFALLTLGWIAVGRPLP